MDFKLSPAVADPGFPKGRLKNKHSHVKFLRPCPHYKTTPIIYALSANVASALIPLSLI